MTVAAKNPSRLARWLRWLWPLSLLLFAWLIAPLRAGATYPGMPCTATADTVFSLASYAVLFIPTAGLLLWLSRRLIPAALRRGLLAWAGGLTAVAIGIAIVFLAFAGVSADRRPFRTSEQTVNCPGLGGGLQALHCWMDGSTLEMISACPSTRRSCVRCSRIAWASIVSAAANHRRSMRSFSTTRPAMAKPATR